MEPTEIIPTPPADLAVSLDRANTYAQASRAKNTRRAYQSDWQDFTTWCSERHLSLLPAGPATVAAYVSHLADSGKKPATIDRRLVAISQAHKLAGHDSPTANEGVRTTVKGIRRTLGTAQAQKAPIL